EAALQVIGMHGFKGLSMERIARELDLAASALYRHYTGKEEVIDAAIDAIGARLHAMVADVRHEGLPALESLRELLRRHIQLAQEFIAIPRLLFSDQVWIGNPGRKARLHAILSGYLGEVAALVHIAQQEKTLCPELNPHTVAVMFLGLFQPAVMMLFLSDGGFDITRHVDQAWAAFLAGVAPRTE
ncbi:MAG TPA: TetR/AcrR family transcriptional regulator, partial [Candidatus Hydrogenedentes bacterium]|nr:TetR/AcrR family transcriptional regulator [Candidatus Hydrogenedentota bacterium]